jgi:Plexin repeat
MKKYLITFFLFSFTQTHRIRNQMTNQEFKVYYVGTNNGRIYKIVQFLREGESKSKLLDIFDIAKNEAIQMMEISQKHKSLYVSTDHRIKQIDLEMCNHRYDSCFRCVKDPYCGWDHDANSCRAYELGLLQVRGHNVYCAMPLNVVGEDDTTLCMSLSVLTS